MAYAIVPLDRFLELWSEREVNELLSEFSCSKDKDVQRYIRKKAIEHEKSQISITYLLFDSEEIVQLVAYVTVAISSFSVDEKRCEEVFPGKMNANRGMAQSYLIGQIGKIDGYDKKIGDIVIDHAMGIIREANKNVGCRVARLDCKDALVRYYETKGFRFLDKRDKDINLMVKILT
jgi:pimeloyl-CoA synthetase